MLLEDLLLLKKIFLVVSAASTKLLLLGKVKTAQRNTLSVNTANGVSTASTQVNASFSTNINNLSDAVICRFMASQPNSPQLAHEDFEKIHPYDMEEIDLRWQMAMLTMRAKRALRNQDNKHNQSIRKSVPVETPASTTLVSCDGLGGYDWSDRVEERPNYVLMAYTSLSSDSKIVDKYKKGLGYESYNAVPPPYTGNFLPLKPDLSFTGLDEFANKPVVENSDAKSSKEETKVVRKNNDAPIIEEWVSDNEEEEMTQPKIMNKTFKPNYKEINGGYVAFGGNPKGEKITRKGTIKTGKLDFENVYFVRELKFNLFSVSQMREKKNSGLFNDNECIILSSNFKIIDESQVLVRVPGKNNMYSVDLKNNVPKGGLTCLFIKSTSDESKLWHRRLGHLNFKTMNKLVKRNLVRGSGPVWLFDINALTRIMNYESIVAGTQSNGFVGTKACDSAGQAKKKTKAIKDYILLPFWTADLLFSPNPKSSHDDGFKPSSDDGKKVNEDPSKRNECYDQEKEDNVNSTNNVNTVSSTVNVVGINRVNGVGELPFDPDMPALEDVATFDFSNEDEDADAVADMNNLDTTIQFSPTPLTRIHKDHPLDQVIKDLHSTTQTRRMSKNLKEHEFDEKGIVIRNKARLVAQGHTQEGEIDYDEVFAPVARIEAIRLFLPYASFKDFVVYQMDVNSAFLYGKIEEEVSYAMPLRDEKFQMRSIGEHTFFLRLQVK
nr:ribonuclease H-like domain-containing protein [Tanacetum cinerariifolium]